MTALGILGLFALIIIATFIPRVILCILGGIILGGGGWWWLFIPLLIIGMAIDFASFN